MPDYKLYYKGKPLADRFVQFVKKYAAKKININDAKALHNFWEKNKENFIRVNNNGLPSIPHGTNKMIELLTKLRDQGKNFYIDRDGELINVSCRELIMQMILVENFVVNNLDSSFFLIKYYEDFDGKDVKVKLPNLEKLSKLIKKYDK
jgi:hypothetical protein